MAHKPADSDSPRTVGAVDNTCRIIGVLHESNGARVTDLAHRLDLSKGAVHTHLATLRKNGFVVQDGQLYHLSLRFLDISEEVKNNTVVYRASKDKLNRLAEETDTRVQLVVEEFGTGVVLAIARGEHAVAPPTRIGKRDYLHCVASGKAILAHLPTERVAEIIDRHGLPKRTKNTITDPETLFDELDDIGSRGIAFNDEEKIQGLRAIGAPILGTNGEVLGAISASGSTSGMKGERYERDIPDLVSNVASTIEFDIRVNGGEFVEVLYDSV